MITAPHIEAPKQQFLVEFDRPRFYNAYWHPAETRREKIGATTEPGAIKVAQYLWPSGSNFKVV
jgi:hypothetical protein